MRNLPRFSHSVYIYEMASWFVINYKMNVEEAYRQIENSKCNLNHFGIPITGKKQLYVCYSECVPLYFLGQQVKALTDKACTCPWEARERLFKEKGLCYKSEFDEARREHELIVAEEKK